MKIETILDYIDNGQIALPEFQRGYVWNRDQVKRLMTSLYRKYPVGSLLVWDTETHSTIHRGNTDLPPGWVKLLLDGQQRITSLYGIIRGRAPEFFDGNTDTFLGLYFNLESEDFSFYMPTRMANDPLWIDVTDLMKGGPTRLGGLMEELNQNASIANNFALYLGRLTQILNIKEIDLHIESVSGQDKSLDIVVEIFNQVNSGGTKLSKGDLALAKICANWPTARKTLKSSIEEWERAGFFFNLDWHLRVLNAILTGEARFEHLHDRGLSEIQEATQTSKNAINNILNLISSLLGLDHDRVLFGKYAFPVMARYMANCGGSITDPIKQKKLLFWYLQCSIWGRYSGSTESIIDRDLALIEDHENALDNLLAEVKLHSGGWEVHPGHFEAWSIGARFYPLLYLLTRTGEARDFGNGLALKSSLLGAHSCLEVHHIFPKSLLYRSNYNKTQINNLANFCFLTRHTNNSVINNRPPKDYFEEVESNFPGVLESQWIPMDRRLWEIDNYMDFLAERRCLLARAANNFFQELMPADLGSPSEVENIISSPSLSDEDGAINQESQPEELIEQIQQWVSSQGLSSGEHDYELTDPQTGRLITIIDLAWPDGLINGQGEAIGLILESRSEEIDAASLQGFKCFSAGEILKKYITEVILPQR